MAKKRGRKSSSRSRSVKGKSTKSKKISLPNYQRKVSLILRNLAISIILFISSWGLYYIFTGELMRNFFWIVALITGFVSVALIIAYLVMLFYKLIGK